MGKPVRITEGYGRPVVMVAIGAGQQSTVFADYGEPVQIVESGGLPVYLTDEDGLPWNPAPPT